MMYLQALQQQPKYTAAVTQMLHDLEQVKHHNLPAQYILSQLPVAMVTHQGVLRSEPPTVSINVTQSRPSEQQDEGMPVTLRPSGAQRPPQSRQSHRPRQLHSAEGPQRGYQARTPTSRPDVQCKACSTNEHTATICKILPRIHSCMECIAAQPSAATELLQQYRKLNHPMTKRQNKERLVNVLCSEIQHHQSKRAEAKFSITKANVLKCGGKTWIISSIRSRINTMMNITRHLTITVNPYIRHMSMLVPLQL